MRQATINTKANGGKSAVPKPDATSVRVYTTAKGVVQQYEKLAKLKKPSDEDVDRLRRLVVSTPAAWPLATHTMASIRQAIIETISHGPTRAGMLAEMDILAKQFGYDDAPILERLLIDHVLVARLRLIHVENSYNRVVVNQSIPFKSGEYWDNLLSSTQARFLRAVETLARVRRLARNTLALQVNIAREGGQQVNVHGAG